jgi:hypothetical protein
MKRRSIIGLILMAGLILTTVTHANPPPQSQTEINYLLDYVGKSACAFYRNGTWYDSQSAQQHLSKKYNYMAALNMIGTAEEFIEKVATQSSMSDEQYQVKCKDGVTKSSNHWLHEELVRYQVKSNENRPVSSRH